MQDRIVIPEGAPLLVMMKDESIIKLPADHGVSKNAYFVAPEDHDHDTDKYTIRAAASIEYAMDAAAVEALGSQTATNIRITAANRNFDIEIHKKSFDDVVRAIQCVQ